MKRWVIVELSVLILVIYSAAMYQVGYRMAGNNYRAELQIASAEVKKSSDQAEEILKSLQKAKQDQDAETAAINKQLDRAFQDVKELKAETARLMKQCGVK